VWYGAKPGDGLILALEIYLLRPDDAGLSRVSGG